VKRPIRALKAARLALIAFALILGACGGGGDDDDAPSGGTTPPDPGALPPELFECFADEGFEIESPNEIHTAPPQVVEECFKVLHESDGGA
jgi:hypothetical protein